MGDWDGNLDEVREALRELGWETIIEPYCVQGEETETFGRGGRFLHLAFGDVEDLSMDVVLGGGGR